MQQRRGRRRSCRKNEVGLQGDEFLGKLLYRLPIVGFRPAHVDPDAAAFLPAELPEALPERRNVGLGFRVALGISHQHADPSQQAALLRPRRKRPCGKRTAESSDEFASPHLKSPKLPAAATPYSGTNFTCNKHHDSWCGEFAALLTAAWGKSKGNVGLEGKVWVQSGNGVDTGERSILTP